MRLSLKTELAIIGGCAFALVAFMLLDSLPFPLIVAHAFFGILVVLYIPGYLIQSAVFPKQDDLDIYERIALTIGLSIAVIPPVALLLDTLPIGIQPGTIAVAQMFLIASLFALSWSRRMRLSSSQRYQIEFAFDLHTWWAVQDRVNRVLYTMLATIVLVGVVAALAIIFIPGPATYFTEFYILGEEGLAENFPRTVKAGEGVTVTIGVTNGEQEAATYHVEVINDGALVGQLDPFHLNTSETVEIPVSIIPIDVSHDSLLEFHLYRNGYSVPYRSLRLWIEVIAP